MYFLTQQPYLFAHPWSEGYGFIRVQMNRFNLKTTLVTKRTVFDNPACGMAISHDTSSLCIKGCGTEHCLRIIPRVWPMRQQQLWLLKFRNFETHFVRTYFGKGNWKNVSALTVKFYSSNNSVFFGVHSVFEMRCKH